jgi:hypothetical protein
VSVSGRDGPLIAVGVLPHANEPLGSAFVPSDVDGRVALVGPIDPPPHRFALPTDPVGYARDGYLQPLAGQVEFAHCAHPSTPAQHRAAALRARLAELRPAALLLVHNDVGAVAPYLYANRVWPAVSRRLRALPYPHRPRLAASWTTTLDACTYAYFPAARIGVEGAECAGLYLERELGIPTLTVELPMFAWGTADRTRHAVAEAVGTWIARGASHGGDTGRLVREVTAALGGRHVEMTPAADCDRVIRTVLCGLREDLLSGSRG